MNLLVYNYFLLKSSENYIDTFLSGKLVLNYRALGDQKGQYQRHYLKFYKN